jgi:iron complex transport system substrate-binding protein
VLEWTDPVFSAGHWVPEMVHRAGGLDVLAKPGAHSRAVALADVEAGAPEVLLFAPCGYGLERAAREAETLLSRDEWGWARGLDAWAIDANALASRPGPRVVEGVEVLAGLMHPSLFGTPALDRARLVRARA